MTRIFEQTEMTALVLTALKSFKNKGRVNNKAFGSLPQTYLQADIEKCASLIQKIEEEKLDVRLVAREY